LFGPDREVDDRHRADHLQRDELEGPHPALVHTPTGGDTGKSRVVRASTLARGAATDPDADRRRV
jgi:hypothetical protein